MTKQTKPGPSQHGSEKNREPLSGDPRGTGAGADQREDDDANMGNDEEGGARPSKRPNDG